MQYGRVQLLISQGRLQMAEHELRQMLTENPDDGLAHCLLSLVLSNDEERFQEATEEAQRAVTLEPDDPFTHYAHSRILWRRNHFREAFDAISEAIRLDPYDADNFAQASQVQFSLRNWTACLELAEQGLSIDPEHSVCNNLRTFALERLGRGHEAVEAAAANLRNSPDDTYSHMSHGWTLLNAGQYREAQDAFRESLRLDPNNEGAREGMIDAISSRSRLFRGIRGFHIWLSRMSHKHQFAIIFGAWILIQVLSRAGGNLPWLQPLIPFILMAYMIFAVLTWTSDAIFNTLLRFHPFGRHLLRPKMLWRSNLVATCLICALGGGLIALALGQVFSAMVVGYYWMLLCVPVTAAFAMPTAKRGWLIAAAGIFLALLPAYGVLQSVAEHSTASLGESFRMFNWGIIGLQVGAGFLAVAPNRQ